MALFKFFTMLFRSNLFNRRGEALERREVGIETIGLGDEFLVGAFFYKMSLMEHQNFIGAADGAQAVGNYYGGAVFHEFGERFLNHLFGDGVQGAGGFVKYEDVRIFQESPG